MLKVTATIKYLLGRDEIKMIIQDMIELNQTITKTGITKRAKAIMIEQGENGMYYHLPESYRTETSEAAAEYFLNKLFPIAEWPNSTEDSA